MMIGRVNTRVFPDPVNAIPIISRPDNLQYKSEFLQYSGQERIASDFQIQAIK